MQFTLAYQHFNVLKCESISHVNIGHKNQECESISHVNIGHKIGIVNLYHNLIKVRCESGSHVNIGHKIGIVNPYHILIKVRCENSSHECEIQSRPRAGRPRTDEFGAYYIKLIDNFRISKSKSKIPNPIFRIWRVAWC